ncbi:hypothetical protein, partial [Pseudomonas baetica]|uniref:hypothetical protein n=1 Tax=Pseudomonas baetica TaxID=674054 RepID=UPI002872AAAB
LVHMLRPMFDQMGMVGRSVTWLLPNLSRYKTPPVTCRLSGVLDGLRVKMDGFEVEVMRRKHTDTPLVGGAVVQG